MKEKKKKERLDVLLVKRGLAESREKAKAIIMTGNVFVEEQREDKAGSTFAEDAQIRIKGTPMKYVSRGGYKLEKAMELWHVPLQDKLCMDVGSSTGGFTDCMLQNGAVKVYTINVQAGEDVGDPVATIDGKEYSFVMNEDGLEAPEGFTAGTTTYKDWDVLSYESPNKKITVVCLKDEDGENHWFIMDAEKDVFTPYQEYSSQYNRYIITAVPDGVGIPDGVKETTLKIGDNSVIAYQSDDIADKDLYLVYAINVEGEEGFYEYDAKEQAFLRYVPMIVSEEVLVPATPTVATPSAPVEVPTEKSPFTNPLVIGIMVGAAVIIVILVVCLVIFAGRINKQNKEMLDAEDMIAQLANANKDVNPELLQKLGLDKPEVSEELEAPQAETEDEKLADAVIDGSTGSEIPTVQEAEKQAEPSDL